MHIQAFLRKKILDIFQQKKNRNNKTLIGGLNGNEIFIAKIWESQANTEPKKGNICTKMHVVIPNFGAKVEVV